MYGKGNRHAQQRRRRKNNRPVQSQLEEYLLIDGNYSNKPYKYCKYYKGFLTRNLMIRHNCVENGCSNLINFEEALNIIEGE